MSHPRDESSDRRSTAPPNASSPPGSVESQQSPSPGGLAGDLYSNLFSRRRASASDEFKSSGPNPKQPEPMTADGGVKEQPLVDDAATLAAVSESLDQIEASLNHAISDLPVTPGFSAEIFAPETFSRNDGFTESTGSIGPMDPVAVRGAGDWSPIFGKRRGRNHSVSDGRAGVFSAGGVVPPVPPTSLGETGLTLAQLCDLILKQMYLDGVISGYDAASRLRLPFAIVDSALQHLRDNSLAEVTSGEMLGRLSFRFQLTDAGRSRARDAFEQCRYIGPAPVTLRSYVEQCRRQAVSRVDCRFDMLERAFAGQIIRPGLLEELGPAICTGKSIFLHGPPGNGKTVIARRLGKFLNEQGGDIYVPYALLVDSSIITLFDPAIHQTTDDAELHAADRDRVWGAEIPCEPTVGQSGGSIARDTQWNGSPTGSSRGVGSIDQRWRRVRRPIISTAGELTLEMLDLRYHAVSNYYTAPAHIKANGGVFLLDDFGRQQMSPRELLNRWILPLEERIDYLTLATGKKFSIPFEQLVIFSTNLNPAELTDDAFLRRIRHRIHVGPPTREMFRLIFELCCQQRKIPFDEGVIRYLFTNHYSLTRPPRWSDPRDLLEIIEGICRFREVAVCLEDSLIAEASRRFFQ